MSLGTFAANKPLKHFFPSVPFSTKIIQAETVCIHFEIHGNKAVSKSHLSFRVHDTCM